MFWKEVNRVRKDEQARDEMVNDVNGQILRDGVEVRRRWAEYSEQVLNVTDVRGANIKCSWQLADAGDRRFQWKCNIVCGSKGGNERNEIW